MLDTSHISPDGAFVTGRHQAQPDMAVAERLGKLPLTAIQKLVQGERGHLHGLAPGFQVGQFQHIQHQLIQPVNFLNHGIVHPESMKKLGRSQNEISRVWWT